MSTGARTTLTVVVAALALALALPAAAYATRYASRTLQPGMHGSDVKRLQRYLTKAGHRTRRDGDFGPRTKRSLKATEKELELHVDGIATRRDQRVIRRAVASPGTGGAAYVPPPTDKVVPGARGKVTGDGFGDDDQSLLLFGTAVHRNGR